eukprot:jgi/Bigna1/37809/e_gw1.22.32.1
MKQKSGDEHGSSQKKRLRVLHLFGSDVSEYYNIVSTKYAIECANGTYKDATTKKAFEYVYARVHTEEPRWSFPDDLSEDALAKAKRYSQAEGVAKLASFNIDACVPHMFCYPGMTTYRSLLDLLGIPFVGNAPETMALTTHKGMTRAIMSQAGVTVPKGEVLKKGENETPSLQPPFILKPCREDNSMGVSLVTKAEDIAAGVATAFKFDDQIIAEEFIPLGRELRIAAVEDEEGNVRVVESIEYHLPKERPIRASTDKLSEDEKGLPSGFAKTVTTVPAKTSPKLRKIMSDMVVKAHKALDCRDYSLYDVRVSPDDTPYFLEAGLYCSFSPRSKEHRVCIKL